MRGNISRLMRVAFTGAAVVASAQAAARLANLSARAVAGPGVDALTAGFFITGSEPKRILVRGAGPALGAFGLPGALAEVRLELLRNGVSLGANSRWDAGADGAAIARTAAGAGAFAFAAGSNDAALLVTLAPGGYSAQVTPARTGVEPGTALVEVYDADPASPSQLVNLSTRARTGPGAATLIAGFVVAGDAGSRMLVRAAGPALADFGVTGVLADPQLEVFQGAAPAGYNDDWSANTNAAQLALVARHAGAFELPAAGKDAALLLPPVAGGYTALVSGVAETSGIALAEVYDTGGVEALPPARAFDLVGFARVGGHGLAALTGGGAATVPYDPAARTGNFWRIDAATLAAPDFAAQFQAALGSDAPLVVELNTMIDLAQFGRPNNGATAIAHPDLFAAGRTTGTVGTLALGSNKTLYSALGNGGFRRGSLAIAGKHNVALRNLKFRELWEWDDATAGQYDRNDWDYLTVTSATSGANVTARAHHLWIDHCDFEKSYDGIADIVHGADLVTVSWCKLAGVLSGETARWVRRQMEYLEANRGSFSHYNARRATLPAAELVRKEWFQLKSNLVGNGTDANTAAHDRGHLNVTWHHNWYVNVDQRMPRMRFGNAHVFNLLADSRAGRGVGGLSLLGVAATSGAAVRVENSTFIDVASPVVNQIGSEPVGYVTVLGSANLDGTALRDRGFDPARTVPPGAFAWNPVPAASGLGAWPVADASVMPAGYLPPGATLPAYLDDKDYLRDNLAGVGIITPANEAEAALLRARWQATAASR